MSMNERGSEIGAVQVHYGFSFVLLYSRTFIDFVATLVLVGSEAGVVRQCKLNSSGQYERM